MSPLTIASTFTPRFSRFLPLVQFSGFSTYDRLHFYPPIFTADDPHDDGGLRALRSPPLSPPDFHVWGGGVVDPSTSLRSPPLSPPIFTADDPHDDGGLRALRSPPLSPPDFHSSPNSHKAREDSYDRLHFHPPIFTPTPTSQG